ncbi:hypothetical protein ACS0TY_029242 [Phlomoides rotata]
MDCFTKTKSVKLKSHIGKYLVDDDDQSSTRQSRDGAARRARWLVELVDTNPPRRPLQKLLQSLPHRRRRSSYLESQI